MSGFNDFVSFITPHDGYSSIGEAAKAFFMPGAYSADKTNEANRQLAAEQNETNWNRYLYDNAYNSPVAQMQRMRAAGLNPSLMYDGGGSIATSTPPPNAVENRDIAPDMTGMPTLQMVLNAAMQKAQIRNIDADTQQKKEETRGKEIQNEVDKMSRDAFYSAYEEGLVHSAVQAGYLKDKYEGEMSRLSMSQAAWNTAIIFGTSLSELFASGDLSDTYAASTDYSGNLNVIPPFSYDEKAFDRSSKEFVGGTEAQVMANAAAKRLSELSLEKNKKDIDIYSKLNDMAESDSWYERAIGKIALLALFISQERFSLPSVNLNIDKGNKTIVLPEKK